MAFPDPRTEALGKAGLWRTVFHGVKDYFGFGIPSGLKPHLVEVIGPPWEQVPAGIVAAVVALGFAVLIGVVAYYVTAAYHWALAAWAVGLPVLGLLLYVLELITFWWRKCPGVPSWPETTQYVRFLQAVYVQDEHGYWKRAEKITAEGCTTLLETAPYAVQIATKVEGKFSRRKELFSWVLGAGAMSALLIFVEAHVIMANEHHIASAVFTYGIAGIAVALIFPIPLAGALIVCSTELSALYDHDRVLWPDPEFYRSRQTHLEVEEQKVHGDARLATEAEAVAVAAEGRRSEIHEQEF